jgi:hypothetical protein
MLAAAARDGAGNLAAPSKSSEVRLDKFAYDPNNHTAAVVLETSRGASRFITGVQDHRKLCNQPPLATLGVGTIIEINLEFVGQQDQNQPAACQNYERIKLLEGPFEATAIRPL